MKIIYFFTLCRVNPDNQDTLDKCKVMKKKVENLHIVDEVYSNKVTEKSESH